MTAGTFMVAAPGQGRQVTGAPGSRKARMKRRVLIVSAIAVAMFRGIALGQEAAVLRDPVVLAQDLQTLRAAGSFAAVLWTRRTTLCTLQVVLGRPQGADRVSTGRWQSRNFNEHAPLVSRGPAPEV